MIWFPSDEAIGNESKVAAPSLTTETGAWNVNLLSQSGDYFETHYAFRPAWITADAKIQASLFQVSNTDSVITGSEGWLFYRSTLPDYLGENPLTERGMWNLAHNVALMQNYASAMKCRFLFLVPPNKNTLYPDTMPYYYQPAGSVHSRDNLQQYLADAGVNYLDLFALFSAESETLYLKQDSHWNNKGAYLVYDAALNRLQKVHTTYDLSGIAYYENHHGDLSNMIYPAGSSLEADYDFLLPAGYTYIPNISSSDPVSLEDFRIESTNPSASGSLLMYRDSFGNTLIPFLSEEYGHAYYSKAVPYSLARDIQQYTPDTVIVELVERNIRNLVTNPPVIPAPNRNLNPSLLTEIQGQETQITQCPADISYLSFSGTLSADVVPPEGKIYLALSGAEGNMGLYEAFTTSTPDSDWGYTVFLQAGRFGTLEEAQKLTVRVFVEKDMEIQ